MAREHRQVARFRTWLAAAIAATTLMAGTPARAQGGLRLVEPGFRIVHITSCAYGWNHGAPHPYLGPGKIQAAACKPGGAWGEGMLLGIATYWDDDGHYIESVSFDGTSTPSIQMSGRTTPTHLAFSPSGWPGGDLLFVNITNASIDPHTFVSVYLPTYFTVPFGLFGGSAGALAVDPSGDFGYGVLFEARTWPENEPLGILRRDLSGNITPFSMTSLVGRFGPGGDWGTDLYGGAGTLDPAGNFTPFPVVFGRNFDWVSGPGFEGDMFAYCGNDICRIKPDGTSTVFATNAPSGFLTSCGGGLWIPVAGDCQVIVVEILDGAAEISPSSLNVNGQGNDVTFRVSVADAETGEPLDPTLLSPAWVSSVSSPTIGTVALPFPTAVPGCDDASQDGLWETTSRRSFSADDNTLALRFSTPADGHCDTMDGDRQDIIALLLDVPDDEVATICLSADYPGYLGGVEMCGTVTVRNRGNR